MKVLLLMGPTASGKSDIALCLAEERGLEIVSADSRQVYRGLRLGTAQPSIEEKGRVPHHLVDFLSPERAWSAQDFVESALALIREREEAPPLVVGGTGFYLRSLREGLFPLDVPDEEMHAAREAFSSLDLGELRARLKRVDPETYARLQPRDRQRIQRALEVERATGVPLSVHYRKGRRRPEGIEWIPVVLRTDRAELHRRIEARLDAMLAGGWIEEVESLLENGLSPEAPGMQSLGYPEIARFIAGDMERGEMRDRILYRTRQYARRQDTWFSREEGALRVDPQEEAAIARIGQWLPA